MTIQTTTLEDLREKLRARLGFASQTLLANDALVSFLEDAQMQLWNQFDWPHLIFIAQIPTVAGQRFYDYPDDCDPTRIIANEVMVLDNTIFNRMNEGIDWGHRSQTGLTGMPQRYDRYAQLEVWPVPDRVYTVAFKYVRNLAPFTEDQDTCDLNKGLILLHALFNGKSHYRQPDAQIYGNQLQASLAAIRAGAISKRTYSRRPEADPPPLPRHV